MTVIVLQTGDAPVKLSQAKPQRPAEHLHLEDNILVEGSEQI